MEKDPASNNLGNPWEALTPPENAEFSPTNPEELEYSSQVERLDDDQHYLSHEELARVAAEMRQKSIDEAPDRARREVEDMVSIEDAFELQLQRASKRGQSKLSPEEFERWEDDFSDDWQRMREYLREFNATSEDEAEAVRPLMRDHNLENTIEAYAGKYYFQRNEALRRAIELGDSEDKKKELELVESLFSKASAHIAYKYISTSEARDMGFESYDRARTNAHNALIHHINSLNDLARKYDVRPLTPRNFWTSEGPQRTSDVRSRMSHDRHQVEAYIENAFQRQVETAKRRQEAQDRYY